MLPKVLASSIIRTSQENEVHGYLYLIDLENETIVKTLQWNDSDISFNGRGGQRGLRGIAFYNEHIYIGSGFKLLEFDKNLELINTYTNEYLDDIHEMEVHNEQLYLVSSGYDAVLEFDLASKSFVKGYAIDSLRMQYKKNIIYRFLNKYYLNPLFVFRKRTNYKLNIFDPNKTKQIKGTSNKANRIHINTISFDKDALCMSGTLSNFQFKIVNNQLELNAVIPLVTHNVLNFDDKHIIYNSTKKEELIIASKTGTVKKRFKGISFNEDNLEYIPDQKEKAVAGWGRGLCWTEDKNIIISGTSPATIMVYDNTKNKMIKSFQISKDIRNAIHGLEIFPYTL
ncbi:MAG: hypothetical protein JXR60_08550 [Bacteroidales bacterium]|nr:hypothetical protein [Bacteroidales bacterium]